MKQHTKKPVTMNKIITTNARLTHIFTVLTALIVLYEGFHIRQGSIIKVVGFIIVTILFYRYAKKTKLEAEANEECTRETFYVQRKQEKWIIYSILILICIFGISSGISFSTSRRPSWEYHRDKQRWEKEFAGLESLPDTIPKSAKETTYYCAEFPKFLITIPPSFYLRYTLNDTDYKQAKKEIIKQGTLQKIITLDEMSEMHGIFHLEPEDIKQHYRNYQTYLFYESYDYNTSGVMLNDETNELCYFYAKYYTIETNITDLEEE